MPNYRVFSQNKLGFQDVEKTTLVDTIKKFYGCGGYMHLEDLGGDTIVLEKYNDSFLYLGKIVKKD